MTTIAKFLSQQDNVVARGIAAVRRNFGIALRQHLEICQVFAEAVSEKNKR